MGIFPHLNQTLRLLLLACAMVLYGQVARAQSTIRTPGARSSYQLELEPHLLLGILDPPGRARDNGIGIGLRATIELVPDGFIAKINDSVGIGFGLDFVAYENSDWRSECTEFAPGPNGTRICVGVDGAGGGRERLFLPVVMQWNFWLTRRWSVFGEPGIFADLGDDFDLHPFALFVGGRYHFTDSVTLTLRIGYPTFSVGASFLF